MIKKDADSSSADKVLKLFRILLSSDKRFYLYELAEKLVCSSQTVIRLINVIEREVGENLQVGKEGKYRWYRLIPKVRPGRLQLSDCHLRYLEICRDLSEPYLPTQVQHTVDKDLFNLSLLLSDDAAFPRNKHKFGFFSKGYIDYTPFFDTIEELLNAAQEKRVLKLIYKASGAGDPKEHLFVPHRLAGMSGALYVLGADVNPDLSLRFTSLYAVQRIRKLSLTGQQVQFEIKDTDFASFGLPWHEPRTFRILFKAGKSADYVRERIWARHQQMIEHQDGQLELIITTNAEPELLAWVRSFGDEAQLLTAPSAGDKNTPPLIKGKDA